MSEAAPALDDVTLIDRWRAGDRDAGRILFERYFDSVYRFFASKFESEADDLAQATFLACVRAKDQFRKDASFRTYLFTIARHELHHRLRRVQRHDAKLDFEASSIAQLVTTPATKLARRQQQVQLLEALRQLPVDQQTLVELHYWEEVGIGELAEIFEAEAATIRMRLHRARKALRDQMAVESDEAMDSYVRDAKIAR